MKYALMILTAVALPMFSAHADESLETTKTTAVQNIDKRIESLQKMKTCVQGSADQPAIATCRKTHRTEMDAIVDAKIDSKIQKLQERKEKRKQ